MPGIMPFSLMISTRGLPVASLWKSVSACRITPEMYSVSPGAEKHRDRYAALFSAVSGIFLASTWPARSHGPALSSAAKKPFPGADIALAVATSSSL